ncbi:MAG: phytanoyl-CoA dioxygenase family protein [Candidatus Poribacteria bacterium]|nr:phytanoyl-CoA dioxygenase family protein [Candidatus Poribacteria bacterium]
MLTQEQVDFYYSNGYIGIEDVLTADEVADLRRVTDEFVEKSRTLTEHTDVFDLEPSHSATDPRVRRIKNPYLEHLVYDRALRHEKILGVVSQLIGDGLRTNGQKLNMKYAEYGSPVEWHQDWAFYPHTNDDLLAVGVSFDDMTEENGALMVIPGSHRGPTYDHHQHGEFVGAITDPNFSPVSAVPVEVKAGGISIHHVRTVHGSALNTSSRPRRLLLAQYCAIDAWPLAGIPDWDTFNSFILRGEPTNQARVESAPVRMPLPHGDRKGSIYEVQSLLDNPVFAKKAS